MTKTFQYNCCFCDRAGEVTYDEPEEFTKQFVSLMQILQKKIACNRCGTFERRRRDLSGAILKRALKFGMLDFDERALATDRYRRIFEKLSAKLCQAYTDRFCHPVSYDPSIVSTLMDKPEKAGLVLRGIHRMAVA